jgi:hypothetical protein
VAAQHVGGEGGVLDLDLFGGWNQLGQCHGRTSSEPGRAMRLVVAGARGKPHGTVDQVTARRRRQSRLRKLSALPWK